MKLHRFLLSAAMAAAVLLQGCGESRDENTDAETSRTIDTLCIDVKDTIGIEMGDSALVFGLIIDAGYAPDSSIMALDAQKCCVSVFSPEGEHLRDIGRSGSGPGEFQFPLSMAFTGSGLAVSDMLGRNVSYFDGQGEYIGQLSGFAFGPPSSIKAGPDSTLYGELVFMEMVHDEMQGSLDISRWDSADSSEPSMTFLSLPISMHMAGEGQTVERTATVDFAIDGEGNLYVAEISDTLLNLQGFSAAGDEILNLNETRERVPRSQEELDAGQMGLSVTMTEGSASASTFRSDDVYPWRNIVESVGLDGRGRIWLEMGDGDNPYFQVYDPGGQQVAVVFLNHQFGLVGVPTFSITPYGMLAYERDPLDYPKIYLLEVTE